MQQVYTVAWHSIYVVMGLTAPPTFVIKIIHITNLLIRTALLCIGVALFYTIGWDHARGIVVFTGYINRSDTEDSVITIIPHGNEFTPIVWVQAVAALIITDACRCILIFSHRWHAADNRLDLLWFGTTGLVLPMLVCCTVIQLGTEEVFILALLVVSVVVASACELCADELHTLVGMETKSENNRIRIGVVWTLRHLHNISLLTVLVIGIFPLIKREIFDDYTSTPAKTALVVVFAALIVLLMFTQFHNHALYIRLAATRRDRCSILPASLHRKHAHIITTTVAVIQNSTNDNTEITDQINAYHYDTDDAAIATNHGEHTNYTDADGDGNGTRKRFGLLVEWRRYYQVNILINALVITNLLDITGGFDRI
jgi:hypothetical protein